MKMKEHRTWVSPAAIPLYNTEIPPSIAPFKRCLHYNVLFFYQTLHLQRAERALLF